MEPTEQLADYVRVSWEHDSVTLTVPDDLNAGAFLDELPWMFAHPRFRQPSHRGPWRRASLFAGGKLIDEIFFIADA